MSLRKQQSGSGNRSEANNTRAVVFGSAVSGIAGYAFSIIAARASSDQDYALIGLLWTLQYLFISVGLLNVEAWIAKTGRTSRSIWMYILAGCLVFGIAGTYSGFTVYGAQTPWLNLLVTSLAIGAAYGLVIVQRGQLAHRQDFLHFGLLNAGESSLRLLLTCILAFVVAFPNWIVYTMAIGPLTAVGVSALWMARGSGEQDSHDSEGGLATRAAAEMPAATTSNALRSQPDVTLPTEVGKRISSPDAPTNGTPSATTSKPTSSARYFAATAFANGASQFLLAGGPLLAAAVHAKPETVSLIFVTITLGRAPLVFVHGGLLARIIPPLQRLAQAQDRTLLIRTIKPFIWLTIGALPVAFVGGWLVGPPIIALAYGNALRPDALFAALTGVSVIGTMAALLFGQLMIAFSEERQLVMPWICGLMLATIVFISSLGLGPVLATSLAGATGIVATTALLIIRIMKPDFVSAT